MKKKVLTEVVTTLITKIFPQIVTARIRGKIKSSHISPKADPVFPLLTICH